MKKIKRLFICFVLIREFTNALPSFLIKHSKMRIHMFKEKRGTNGFSFHTNYELNIFTFFSLILNFFIKKNVPRMPRFPFLFLHRSQHSFMSQVTILLLVAWSRVVRQSWDDICKDSVYIGPLTCDHTSLEIKICKER